VRYLLDTTFAIDFLRSQPEAIRRFERLIEGGDEAFINDVVVCELATGARAEDAPGLSAFIRAVEYVQPGPDVALVAGRWRSQARARGFTISVPDVLIAAAADSLAATLVTRNVRDFAQLPVAVEDY
jgi:predicted nucleic acid-binding protein